MDVDVVNRARMKQPCPYMYPIIIGCMHEYFCSLKKGLPLMKPISTSVPKSATLECLFFMAAMQASGRLKGSVNAVTRPLLHVSCLDKVRPRAYRLLTMTSTGALHLDSDCAGDNVTDTRARAGRLISRRRQHGQQHGNICWYGYRTTYLCRKHPYRHLD